MSGGMYQGCHANTHDMMMQEQEPMNGLEQGEWNPLLCYLCHQTYREPCLLACYHTFCAGCLKGRSCDGKLSCPICGKITSLRDGHSIPPTDSLLRFLVESSSDEFPSCANCDRNEKSPMFFCNTCVCWSSPKHCDHFLSCVNGVGLPLGQVGETAMFYCNTCGQALCGTCRDETHRAKMFSQHDVIHMSKKAKELHRKCQFHNEPFTMFCTTKKTMLCIKCFRDTSMDARLHCVDLDTAYNQGAKKLERALVSIKELQNSLRDGVILFRALLEELRQNMENERRGIISTYDLLHEAIKQTYDTLLSNLDTHYAGTDRQLRAQLNSLGTMLPTVQMHLIMCTTFSSTANKFEFLNMAYHLIDRLTALAHLTYPLRPGHNSDMATDYKVKFVQCLEPVMSSIAVSDHGGPGGHHASRHDAGQGGDQLQGHQAPGNLANGQVVHQAPGSSSQSQKSVSKSLPVTPKHKSSARVEFQTDFPEHCQMFDGHMKVLNKRFGSIKGAVSDLHRDVTTRRCLTSYERVEDIVRECVTIKTDLDKADDMMDDHKMEFEKRWQQEQLRIKTEQAMFNEQIMELAGLKNELRHLLVIAQQLEPYIRSISSLMERIQPQVGATQEDVEEEDNGQVHRDHESPPMTPAPVYQGSSKGRESPPLSRPSEDERIMAILERIQTMKPDHKQRFEALHKQESSASLRKSSNSPYDEQILQQKQLLRTSSKEDYLASNSPKRNDCTAGGSGNGTAMWLATTTADQQSKMRFQERNNGDALDVSHDMMDMPDPPLEYCELPRKGVSETNGDLKRGILSSIFDKVRSKEEGGRKTMTVDCLPFSKDENRKSQPLLDNLLLDCALVSKRTHDSGDSIVQKPYEPPALGKSSRITPVGGVEESLITSHSNNGLEADAVEVLSVIRYNKSKTTSSVTPSTLRSNSGSGSGSCSDSNSVISQQCLACSDNRLTQSERSLDDQATRLRDRDLEDQHRSRSGSRPGASEAENLSFLRRSSAPEIDHESPAEEEVRSRREMYTRSLGRTRRQGMESGRSSDGESNKHDAEELQRARDHLKETLEGKIGKLKKIEAEKQNQSETKAVVHRSENQHIPAGKTLDTEAIKHHQSIKQNTASLGSGGKQRYSGVFGEGGSKTGVKERHPTGSCQREYPGIYKQSSFDNLQRTADNSTRDRFEGATTSSLRGDSHSPLFVPELKKQDSFEGHEAAVRSLVEAVHESRKLEAKQRKKSEG